MLAKIVMKNFKSFKNKTEVSFIKTNYTLLPQNVSNEEVLKGGVFVGANASGKSNFILSIKLLLDFLFKEREINSGLFPCLFSKERKFVLEYYFKINGEDIKYCIEIDSAQQFIKEELFQGKIKLLSRLGDSAESFITDSNGITYGSDDVAKDTLFLRTLYFHTKFSNNPTLIEWMAFLENSAYINPFEKTFVSYGKEKMDLNSYLNTNGCEKINDFFDIFSFDQIIEYSHTAKGTDYSISFGENEEDKSICFRRKGINEPIPFGEESCGNQNLLRILPTFINVMENGGILLMDEFSSCFHNELEELLIKYFMKNSSNSQMFFVSHSTNVLSNSIIRPDQAYSVEFNGANGSRINRFSNQQPRAAQNIEKMYNSGVFGGLPNYEEKPHEN